ncbi:PREDICTED: uncharacterized protein LOC106813029 [Priapulus caudatus]|uniref:Uncharacterized protein LOC106813029 n=1 Tax=Priapulus caudatus TaxID=37621 RepID=A0ABM1EK38_PRICU|nr:PREDICTED: uncharacterized protein LOC106813029 [Priapulus caudatus]
MFGRQLYQQKFGTAMGSPVSQIVANLYMEDLEQTAINTASEHIKPRFWKRYVDDILAVVTKGSTRILDDHLNSIHTSGNIQFTSEVMGNNSIPFLDTKIVSRKDGTIKTVVYRKKTHTNQYLNFQFHHPIIHKLGVVRTLLDRANTVVTEPEDLRAEELEIRHALRNCGYPNWTIEDTKRKIEIKVTNNKLKKKGNDLKTKNRGLVIIPYIKGMSERLARTKDIQHLFSFQTPQDHQERLSSFQG